MTDEREPVGSVGEEAVKLLQALQGWARQNGPESDGSADAAGPAPGAGAAASGFSSILHDVNEHIATGGDDCRYCPVCQLIRTVRETSPEVKQHLTTAATSFMQAVTGVMAAYAQQPASRPDVEKIDLDDDTEWEDD